MNRVSYRYDEGSFKTFQEGLHRAVGQYARHNEFIYVGLTQRKPETRFAEHQRKWARGHQWDRMVVIFHGTDYDQMCECEDYLIEYVKRKRDEREARGDFSCQVVNDIDHAEPNVKPDYDGFWVYICLQKEHRKGGL